MNIKISYQTLILPPPYSFGYTFELVIGKEELNVEFEMEYLDREGLSEEEILSEGFTLNDDFSWKGKLPKSWCEELSRHFEALELSPNSSDENLWIHFDISKKNEHRSGLVKDVNQWDVKLQELIQAVYEVSGLEKPLDVRVKVLKGSDDKTYQLNASFANLTSKVNGREIEWASLQEMIKRIFSCDFKDQATKSPKKDGIWIDADGSGRYYQLKASESTIESLAQQLGEL